MYLEIVSPEKTLFNGDIDSVLVPGADGDFQMLNNHAPIVSTLITGTIKIFGEIRDLNELPEVFSLISSKEIHLNISSGVIEMKENKVIILTD
ncbi:MAG TPA: F0F1 ATP synthase subunit epsilon [Flavobacteriaceae bacterium]|jgi:F-type H+-transporting ATPase subunit epsilon|nr:F0F1 ATP synthase subunit epsilon [Flavobacteriaceae bacterium]